MNLSIRNQIEGTVTGIVRGAVVSEVTTETQAGFLSSVISTRAVDALMLRVGDRVHLLVDAADVFLEKSHGERTGGALSDAWQSVG